MSSIFLFLWSMGLPWNFPNTYSIHEQCSLHLAQYNFQVLVYDENEYLISSNNPNEPAWINWLENPNSNDLFVDSCNILLTIKECINPRIIINPLADAHLFTLVCFYSNSENQPLHEKRIELLQKLSTQIPFRLLLVLQSFPHQVYLENSASDE